MAFPVIMSTSETLKNDKKWDKRYNHLTWDS